MEIRFIGTGGAFDIDQGNSAAIVEVEGRGFLIDCGNSIFPQLLRKGLERRIDSVLLTHFHDDHVGSLSSFIIHRTYVRDLGPLEILVPTEEFGNQVHEFLSFSLGKNSPRYRISLLKNDPNVSYVDTFGQHIQGMQTWAYCFRQESTYLAFSGDLGQPQHFFAELEQMGALGAKVFHEVSFHPSPAHSHYKILESYMDRFDIYGYHCNHHQRPADLQLKLVADHPELLF